MRTSVAFGLRAAVAVATLLSAAPAALATDEARDTLLIDEWKFFQGDEPKAAEASFDDSAWRTVDLPHDWSVESPFDSKLASCTAFLPCGIGWYRKTFTIPADAKDKSVSIRFDGVSNH